MSTTVIRWDAWRHDESTVYIGRPSMWGNPFRIGRDGGRESVLRLYRVWIESPEQKGLRNQARCLLRGKKLACFCVPRACHGHILAEIADSAIEP